MFIFQHFNRNYYFILFTLINLGLYAYIIFFHQLIPFSNLDYLKARHYINDNRVDYNSFNLINALAQWDAQWYLKIAETGYPYYPTDININDFKVMDGLTYAFFPLYPITIKVINGFVGNFETSAFLLTNLLLVGNFLSLIYVVRKFYSKEIAVKTAFLLFLFPFSIFFRSYFTESLQLFLLIWFSYFFLKDKFFICGIFLAFLNITKANLLPLNLVYIYYLGNRISKTKKYTELLNLPLVFFPLLIWILFCYLNTGDPFYFNTAEKIWSPHTNLLEPFLNNLQIIANFLKLPLHSFERSKIEVLSILIFGILIYKSKKILPAKLWLISFVIWITPLLVKNTLSFSRLQIISFPIFIFLALRLKNAKFNFVITSFSFFLLLVSIYFINWYWVG